MLGIDQTTPIGNVADTAATYLPEPSTSGMGVFRDVLDKATSVAGEIGGVSLDVAGGLGELLQTQMQFQMEMAAINLVSNIEKSKHESKMSVIRNIRVS